MRRTVRPCGKGAHVYVPKHLIGKNIEILIDDDVDTLLTKVQHMIDKSISEASTGY